MTELGVFSSLFIVHCVFNGFLSYTCTMLNIVTIHALRKTPSFPMTLKALLLSLSASDLGVGLIVQPLYVARLVMIIGGETQTQTYKIIEHMVLITGNLFSYTSFLGVVALAADRFLAIHYHLRYQELVTHKRTAALMTSIWIFSSFLSFLTLSWIIPEKAKFIFYNTIEIFCIITTALFYWKIYLSAKHHIIEITDSKFLTKRSRMVKWWRILRDSRSLQLVHFTCFFCFWLVICQCFALVLPIWALGCRIPWYSFYCLTLIHWFFSIRLSILWSTAGKWDTFDAPLWISYATCVSKSAGGKASN